MDEKETQGIYSLEERLATLWEVVRKVVYQLETYKQFVSNLRDHIGEFGEAPTDLHTQLSNLAKIVKKNDIELEKTIKLLKKYQGKKLTKETEDIYNKILNTDKKLQLEGMKSSYIESVRIVAKEKKIPAQKLYERFMKWKNRRGE